MKNCTILTYLTIIVYHNSSEYITITKTIATNVNSIEY